MHQEAATNVQTLERVTAKKQSNISGTKDVIFLRTVPLKV